MVLGNWYLVLGTGTADLLGLDLAGGNGGSEEASQPSVNGNGFSQEAPTNNLSKYVYSCNNVQSVIDFPFWVASLNLRVRFKLVLVTGTWYWKLVFRTGTWFWYYNWYWYLVLLFGTWYWELVLVL